MGTSWLPLVFRRTVPTDRSSTLPLAVLCRPKGRSLWPKGRCRDDLEDSWSGELGIATASKLLSEPYSEDFFVTDLLRAFVLSVDDCLAMSTSLSFSFNRPCRVSPLPSAGVDKNGKAMLERASVE